MDVNVIISRKRGLIEASANEPHAVMVACIHSFQVRQVACSYSPRNILQSSIYMIAAERPLTCRPVVWGRLCTTRMKCGSITTVLRDWLHKTIGRLYALDV